MNAKEREREREGGRKRERGGERERGFHYIQRSMKLSQRSFVN